jgi:hypothetical protein
LPRAHEELVVTAVAVAELEEPDDPPEVEAPVLEELDFEREPEVDFELEPEDLPEVEATFAVEPEPDDLPAMEATFASLAAAAFTRAGSLPVTSWIRIPPELARKIAVANATTRLRIALIRCLRPRSRSATRPSAPDPAAERRIARPVTGAGRASLEGTGVIVSSISDG